MNLDGTWKVKTKSGPLWFRALDLLGDVKVISGNAGYNKARGVVWGPFEIFTIKSLIVFRYTTQPIVDKVKFTGNDRLFGGFYYKGKYIGNFEMVRI